MVGRPLCFDQNWPGEPVYANLAIGDGMFGVGLFESLWEDSKLPKQDVPSDAPQQWFI